MGLTYGLLDETNAEVQRRAARAGGWTRLLWRGVGLKPDAPSRLPWPLPPHPLPHKAGATSASGAVPFTTRPPGGPHSSKQIAHLACTLHFETVVSVNVSLRTSITIKLFHSIGPAVEVELSSRERSARGRTMRVCRQDGERAAGRIGPCGAGTTAALHCPPRHARYYFALRYCRPLSKASARPSWCGHGLILLAVPVGGTGIGRWRALRCVTRLLPLGRWDSVPSAVMPMAAC